MSGFLSSLLDLVDRTGARSAHEVGCGEGELARRIAKRGLDVRGTDASRDVIEEARRRAETERIRIDFRAARLEDLRAPQDAAELVVCCEVLEHVADPAGGLEVVAELASPWAILSVPREPLWRALNLARGKYTGSLGNTPGHRNHWRRHEFVAFCERRLDVVDVRTPPPWTMALGRARP